MKNISPIARGSALIALLLAAASPATPQDVRLPNKSGSLKFAIIGDTGTASREQIDVGHQMALYHAKFPFELVIMVGDNIYGADSANDFRSKFEDPYKELLAGGMKFYACLGNHDNPTQRSYKLFNMGGERFYTFKPQNGVRFFALDSNYMDKPQLDWLEKELAKSGSEWKIAYFHHPMYSSGRTHGSSLDLRALVEPLFRQYGVNVVFAGHDHIYERIKPQNGIYYFVAGSAGSLRVGDYRKQAFSETGFDRDFTFMLAEIDGEDFNYQAVTCAGQVVDSGKFSRPKPAAPPPTPAPSPTAAPTPAPTPVATPEPAPTPSPQASPSPAPSPKAAATAKKKPAPKRRKKP
jgi:predicted phosphodiesterase